MNSPAASHPTASQSMFSADRIARIGDRYLGRFRMTAAAQTQLSQSRIGLFVDGFLTLESMLRRLLPLADKGSSDQDSACQVIVLYPSQEAGRAVYNYFANSGRVPSCRKSPAQWQVGHLQFNSVEGLARLTLEGSLAEHVILLDPTCMVYRARSLVTRYGRTHDRPQIVVDFLEGQVQQGLSPVLTLMTSRPAAAVPTDTVARAFSQETFWFLDGSTFRS